MTAKLDSCSTFQSSEITANDLMGFQSSLSSPYIVLVQSRKTGNCPYTTEKLLTGMYSINTNKQIKTTSDSYSLL